MGGSSISKTNPQIDENYVHTINHSNASMQKNSKKTISRPLLVYTFNACETSSPLFCSVGQTQNYQFGQLSHKIAELRQNKYRFLVPQNTQHQIGYFNRKLVKGRYSPYFQKYAGIFQDTHTLMDRSQFTKRWQQKIKGSIEQFSKILNKCKSSISLEIILNQLKQYDFMCYHGILSFVYREQALQNGNTQDNFIQIINNNSADKYRAFQQHAFNINILSKQYCARKLVNFIQKRKVDIVMIQQIDRKMLEYLQKYTLSYRLSSLLYQNKNDLQTNSLILIRKTLTYEIGLTKYQQNLPLEDHNRYYINYKKRISHSFTLTQQPTQLNLDPQPMSQQQYKSKQKPMKLAPIQKLPELKKNLTSQNNNSAHSVMAQSYGPIRKQNNKNRQKYSEIIYNKYQVHQKFYNKSLHDIQSEAQLKLSEEQIQYLQIFQFVQFFGTLILISAKITTQAHNISTYLNHIHLCLQNLHKKYQGYVIILGISIQIALTSKSINPNYLYALFQGGKQSNFYISPKLTNTRDPNPKNIQVNNANGEIIHHNIYTVRNKYPECHFSSPNGSTLENTQDYIITNFPISNQYLSDVEGTPLRFTPDYIPNNIHPYNHYLVGTMIQSKFGNKGSS